MLAILNINLWLDYANLGEVASRETPINAQPQLADRLHQSLHQSLHQLHSWYYIMGSRGFLQFTIPPSHWCFPKFTCCYEQLDGTRSSTMARTNPSG